MISENAEFTVATLLECEVEAGEALPLLISLASDHVASGLSPLRFLSVVVDVLNKSDDLSARARSLCLLLMADLTMASTSSLLKTVWICDQKRRYILSNVTTCHGLMDIFCHQTIPIVLGLCGDCEAIPPLVLSHYLVAVLQFMPNHEGDRQLHSSVSLLAQMVAQGNDK